MWYFTITDNHQYFLDEKTEVQGGFVIPHKALENKKRTGPRSSALCHLEVGGFVPYFNHCIHFVFPPRDCEIQLVAIATDPVHMLPSEVEKQQAALKSRRSLFCFS